MGRPLVGEEGALVGEADTFASSCGLLVKDEQALNPVTNTAASDAATSFNLALFTAIGTLSINFFITFASPEAPDL